MCSSDLGSRAAGRTSSHTSWAVMTLADSPRAARDSLTARASVVLPLPGRPVIQSAQPGPATAPKPAVSTHPDPMAALHAALAVADPTDRILVFGSFFTVGGVLHEGLPRLNAPHMPSDAAQD